MANVSAHDRHFGGHAMTIAALKALCSRLPWCEPAVLESVLELALEIAREGREGRRIGTLFTLGKADEVLAGPGH
jgi:diadenylate cyclase